MSPKPSRRVAGEATPSNLRHNAQKLPAVGARHRVDMSDPNPEPPEEPGVSIEAMETGAQFLRDATEQSNFESRLGTESDHDDPGAPVAQMISEGTLQAANQADFDLPVSGALADDEPEVSAEPDEDMVDLTSDAIVEASLFDHPVSDLSEEEEESEAEDDLSATLAAPLRQPQVTSDDPSEVHDERRAEIQRLLDERVKKRLRVDTLPKDAAK